MTKNNFTAFWAELSPCSHVVEIYEDDGLFLDHLADFAADGLANNEAVVAIVTYEHRVALESRLRQRQLDVGALQARDQLILLDAGETISRFLVKDWPQDDLFHSVIGSVLKRATADGRKVRAFGEMVALMWAKGQCGATIRLEHLWTDLCRKREFSLFCAYPKAGFTADAVADMERVCNVHSVTFQPRVHAA